MGDMQRVKRQLLRRLRELGVRLEGIEAELLTHSDPDWDDMALMREADEVLEALGESGQREIVQIRAALERIESGSYGTCVSCGEKIDPARLVALPATPLCRGCAQGAAQ